ncbi:MAG TPA: AsnC family transcriptional regulator [Hyphomicrobium sp.]|nr:AsnC family transcriptional regulator [Hyphomicrobium sp.]
MSNGLAAGAMLDELDRAVINRLQLPLPLEPRPFAAVSRELGCSEDELIERTQRLLQTGMLTRFGPFIDAEAAGGAFCLCAMAVPAERFEAVAGIVNSFEEVAHNYERDHVLSMWFVLATDAPAEIARVAGRIEGATGCQVLLFPKEKEFFIGFKVAA